jgi:hypothetical protein
LIEVTMDKTTAIELLRVHIEERWKNYAAVLPHASLALIGDQWQQIPLPTKSADAAEYVEALRAITRSLNPRAVAFVARGVGGSHHFFAAVEFPDDPVMRSLIWMIVDDALVSLGVMEHQPSDDEDHEMRLFERAAAPPAPLVDPVVMKDHPRLWKLMRQAFLRISIERKDQPSGG